MAEKASTNGLMRWLLGGLVAGAIVLGLLIGAYAVGYHRGHDDATTSTVSRPAPPTSTETATTPAAQGPQLFAKSCASCHSLTGAAGVGPTVRGLSGSRVTLTDGSTVVADTAYLARSITDPNAQIVKGFTSGVMSAAISSLGLKAGSPKVEALVAYLETVR